MGLRKMLGAVALMVPVCLQAVEHNDTYQRSFPLGGGERRLEIENINGHIRVTGDSGADVRVTVREHFRAESDDELRQARDEVRLEMRQEGNTVRLYLDGPFRDRDRQRRRGNSWHFRHDFDVQVPREIALMLKTINGHEVSVSNVSGKFDLHNINGSIEMNDVAGSGTAKTINGQVRATFVRNPQQASLFETLNGTIDVSFQPDFSADVSLSTMHGDAYTDFEFGPVATSGSIETSRSGDKGFRYRISDRNKKIRIGNGGIEHQFKTLNGSIKIRKYGKQA